MGIHVINFSEYHTPNLINISLKNSKITNSGYKPRQENWRAQCELTKTGLIFPHFLTFTGRKNLIRFFSLR